MDRQLQHIINAYDEFKSYTYMIHEDIQELNKYSRQELIAFKEELRKVSDVAYIFSDIDKIIEQKKIEEYPELLKAHHYPEINEMNFLCEEDKVELDDFLLAVRFNNYIYRGSSMWNKFSKMFNKETIQKILNFLLDKNILEKQYRIGDSYESTIVSKDNMKKYIKYFELKDKEDKTNEECDEYYNFDESLELYIFSEDLRNEDIPITKDMIDEALNDSSDWVYRLIKSRDTSLDNV